MCIKEKILDFDSKKSGSKEKDGNKNCVILNFYKKNSNHKNKNIFHRHFTKCKEFNLFQKNTKDLQINLENICNSLNRRIETIRGQYNYNLYKKTSVNDIKNSYPQIENIFFSSQVTIIIEVIRLIWGWLMQCCINPEDIEKCKEAMSVIISAYNPCDTQVSLLKKFYAANIASDLMDKYFPFTKQTV